MAEALPAVAPEHESDECSVCVAVHVRPLIDSEVLEGCDSLLTTTPQQPQVCRADLPVASYAFKILSELHTDMTCRSSLGLTASHTIMFLERKARLLICYMVAV